MQEREDDLFPSLRDYLVERFGREAGSATLQAFWIKAGGIKDGGYGWPHFVRWSTPAGPRTLVLETVRPGQFGHEDRGPIEPRTF